MNRYTSRFLTSIAISLALIAAFILLAGAPAMAQCTEVTPGLQFPLGITQSDRGNLIISESTTGGLNSGRISIVDRYGTRRTLLGGLPSAINDVGQPSGPAGLFMEGRTLYVAIGIGDTIIGAGPGTAFANPNPSAPIFSSILSIEFSSSVERTTAGFALTPADYQRLANGHRVKLRSGGDKITVELIANFPDYTPNPPPPANVRGSNPFDLVGVGNRLYVTDGGQNTVRKVNINSGAFSTLATFPNVANPLFPALGGSTVEAVPTGISYSDGKLLVTLFRGFPFPQVSVVEQVNPTTGAHTPLITGRKTAIDVLAIRSGRDENDDDDDDDEDDAYDNYGGHDKLNQSGNRHDGERGDTDYLVLQHASGPGPMTPPGLLLRFETPAGPPTTVANCLNRPTSMTLDKRRGKLYIVELGPPPPAPAGPGRLVSVVIAP